MKIALCSLPPILAASIFAFAAQSANAQHTASSDRNTHHEKILQEFDGNGDGALSCEERVAARESRHQQRRHDALERFDADGDGRLTRDERSAARQARAARRAERIAQRDGMRRDRLMKRCESGEGLGDARHPGGPGPSDAAEGGA